MTFDVSSLALMLIGIVIATGAVVVLAMTYISKKNGEEKDSLFAKIRPIISQVVIEAAKIWEADKGGYEALRTCAIDLAMQAIDKMYKEGVLLEIEKDLLTRSAVESFLDPFLKLVWDADKQEVSMALFAETSTD